MNVQVILPVRYVILVKMVMIFTVQVPVTKQKHATEAINMVPFAFATPVGPVNYVTR